MTTSTLVRDSIPSHCLVLEKAADVQNANTFTFIIPSLVEPKANIHLVRRPSLGRESTGPTAAFKTLVSCTATTSIPAAELGFLFSSRTSLATFLLS